MAGTAKRVKSTHSDDSDCESDGPINTCDHLTMYAGPDAVLMQGLPELLGSPYDWRSLRAVSRNFSYMGNGPASFLTKSVKDFKAGLQTWQAEQVLAEASKELPNGDQVMFASRKPSLLHYGSDTSAAKILDALKVLLKKQEVVGWPPIPDHGWLSLAIFRDDSDSEAGVDDDNDRQHDLVLRGAVEVIVTIMERWPSSAQVQEKGCFLFSRLYGPKDLQRRCVLLIRNAMDMHHKVPELQAAACKALKHFCFIDRKFVLSVEAIKAVCIAMGNHPSSLRVQYAACDFLGAFVSLSGKSAGHSRVFEEIRKTDVMKLMLAAVTTHIGKRGLQRDAWIVISGLLRDVKDVNFFGVGGVAAMRMALSEYASEYRSPGVVAFVLDAFKWACMLDDGGKHIDENVANLATSAFIKDSSIVNYSKIVHCCEAFGHLAQDIRWAAWLSEKGIVEHIVKFVESSLNFRLKNPSYQSRHPQYIATTFALTRLVQQEPLQVVGAIRAVLRAMIAIPKELELQVQGCAFLASLHWSPLNAVRASAFFACKSVLSAMVAHADQEAMQEQGCLALTTLLAHDGNRVTAAKLNGVQTLVQAIENFPGNDIVQEQGRMALKIMGESNDARKLSAELRLIVLLHS